ncbi:hypothetical protein CCACVL1_29159 [Corchorus capsularis]|uniref:ADP-ribosyl cyclase/cyclic ADP-ribose hydrolase n=1 Tax=Corchorus capsularis TaxID=210143 RepID=A0A1R3G3I6_COCAP|nr:hypothetical protein CCACVL1_29159 [Corchorus capsularis]
MALQLWETLDEAICYVLTGLFGSPDDHRALKEQVKPLPPPLQITNSKEELKQYDGFAHVSQSRASSSSSSNQPKYQVFLSFRGADTRHGFTSHLLKALKDKGIAVFFDDEKLEKGEELSPALLKAIAASKISIVILSKDYASSKSCLTELSKIMKCKGGAMAQIVLPIFYHVDPSDVRNIAGSFKESFEKKHQKRKLDEVNEWKDEFSKVGKLKGWHIEGGNFDRSEPEYIKDIVEDMEKILSLIDREDTRVIGIWGMGGIGKTTLAEAVYNEIVSSSKFSAHHFLRNVSEKCEKQGMEFLRDQLVSKLLDEKDIHIDTPSIGSTLIQERLHNKGVFVILDDVNDSDQIEHLGLKHFGLGSKVIVTSRDQQVLRNIEVDEVYEVEKLNEDDSLQLFSKFAFKQYNPVASFRDLAMKFVKYAGGNPLALKVLGSSLYKKSRNVWESALDKLKEYPEPKIINVLKVSFDGLDDLEKNIFLDIAIFFKGESLYEVTELLKCCYKGAEFGISNLVDKCLVDVRSGSSAIDMHDLLQEMGRDIVRQESEDPGRRNRLWNPEDVYYVLKNNKGTESIKGISLDMSQFKELPICPDFNPQNLVELSLRNSTNIEQLWNGDPDVVNLRQMDLYGCKKLQKIPNLSGAMKLQILLCQGCESLVELPCMTHLISLNVLDLEGCAITKFPEAPTNLVGLSLPGTQVEEVPSSIGTLKKLRSLNVRSTKIQSIPSSIVKLDALEYIDLSHCPNITELNLNIITPTEEVPLSISGLQSLRALIVENCKSLKSLSELPPWLGVLDAGDCISLERVSFMDCDYQRELDSITHFRFSNCFNLNLDALDNIIVAYPMIVIEYLAKQAAKQLTENKLDVYDEESSHEFNSNDRFFSRNKVLHYLPGSEIPNKFEHQCRNSSITVKFPFADSRRFLCFSLCLVLDFEHFREYKCFSIHIEYQLKGTCSSYQNFKREWDPIYNYKKAKRSSSEHVFILFRDDMVHRDMHTEASFDFHVVATKYYTDKSDDEMKVEKCGVHVFYINAESLTVSDVGSSISFNFDEDNRCQMQS